MRTPEEFIKKSYKLETDQFFDIIRTAGYLGIQLKDLLSMSMKMLVYYRAGVMQRYQNDYNNLLGFGKQTALKVSQAVWGNRHFNDKLNLVDWTSELLPENRQRIINMAQNQTLERLKRQYGVDVVELANGGKLNG